MQVSKEKIAEKAFAEMDVNKDGKVLITLYLDIFVGDLADF